MNEQFKNGMYKERTKQAALQGLLLFVFLCALGVMSYIVSMIPAGIFGVAVAKSSTGSQLVYDAQNLINTVIGLAILCLGGLGLSKKAGESDAMIAFQNGYDRKMDMRYLAVSVAVGVVVYVIVGLLMNVEFIIGPIRYLGIFYCRAERSINEGIKVALGWRALATLTVLIFVVPCLIKGVRAGFMEKMASLEEDEEENIRQQKLREELEAERQQERQQKKF
ncbi:MAG: hypothetical protein E7579_08345 [Ruminococcaceae bacterium]|nr:hypothetical protein [Oscillospiraceae bacterium]